MPAVTPDLGHGTTITFDTNFFARITSLSWDGVSRAMIDTTTFDTSGGKTFTPSDTSDPGSLTVEFQYKTDDAPPLSNAQETVTVTWGDSETHVASGALSDFSIRTADEEVTTATGVVKFSGNITW